jgi:hypothetical protein
LIEPYRELNWSGANLLGVYEKPKYLNSFSLATRGMTGTYKTTPAASVRHLGILSSIIASHRY